MPSPITIQSALPAEDLLFESMTASAGLSTLGEMQLSLLSPRPDLKPEDLLGQPLTVKVKLRDDSVRHFNGYVTRFGMAAHRGSLFGYHATVHNWLWFLTRTADCRIFQDLSVPDIVRKVFEDHGVASFDFKLFRSYRKWVYCVQYRESDYNFVARLLEHEGIYWYTVHSEGGHKVVLVDARTAHTTPPRALRASCPSSPSGTSHRARHRMCISDWTFSREVRSGKVMLSSYDFERPSTELEGQGRQGACARPGRAGDVRLAGRLRPGRPTARSWPRTAWMNCRPLSRCCRVRPIRRASRWAGC